MERRSQVIYGAGMVCSKLKVSGMFTVSFGRTVVF